MRRRLAGDVLRAVAATLGDPVPVAELHDPRLGEPATARYLAEGAAHHNILPLLWAGIERQPGADALADEVRGQYRPVVARALLMREMLARAVGALDAAGVQYAVFKGPAMWRYYREPRHRVGVDIDVLIDARALRRVRPILRAAGFVGPVPPPADRAPGLAESEYQLPGLGSLDVHWHLMREARVRASFAVRTDDLLARAQRVTLDGLDLPVLDHCDTVIAVATHACYDGGYKLGWLVDLGLALRAADPGELRARCTAARVDLPVSVMLDRLRISLGAQVPALGGDDAWRAALRMITRARPVSRSFQQPLRAGVIYRSTQHGTRSSVRELLRLIRTEAVPEMRSPDHRVRQHRAHRDRAVDGGPV